MASHCSILPFESPRLLSRSIQEPLRKAPMELQQSSLERIERETHQNVMIEAAATSESIAKCNPQDSCPLFTLVPREIRDLVWAYATAPYENEQQKYAENEYYYRPDHTARLSTDTNLLLTCRRVWLEANALPMLQAEHCFWYHRAAPDARSREWMGKLTRQNRNNFGHLRLFPQMFAIEHLNELPGNVRDLFLPANVVAQAEFRPRILHVTVRHTDWWNWEYEDPLRLKDSWVHALLNSEDLRSTHIIRLDLETLNYKVAQLEPIVERVRELESKEKLTHIVDEKPVRTVFKLVDKSTSYNWRGPADINNQSFRPYRGKDTLDYHVVTLTWKLHFPDLPHAHVPMLRLAPRYNNDILRSNENARRVLPDAGVEASDRSEVFVRRITSRGPRTRRFLALLYEHYERIFRIRSTQTHIQSQLQADAVESQRRLRFNRAMDHRKAAVVAAGWKAENSLLVFVEEQTAM